MHPYVYPRNNLPTNSQGLMKFCMNIFPPKFISLTLYFIIYYNQYINIVVNITVTLRSSMIT
jgi:hypothetical protein